MADRAACDGQGLLATADEDELGGSRRSGFRRRPRLWAAAAAVVAGVSAAVAVFSFARPLVQVQPRDAMVKWSAAAIPLITVNTRSTLQMMPMLGVPGRVRENCGVGLPWHGYITKATSWSKAVSQYAAEDPERIVILMDSDILDGGCTDAELLDRYHKVVEASGGAKIVAGVDAHQWPRYKEAQDRFMNNDWQARRKNVMAAFNMDLHAFDSHEDRDGWFTSYSFVNSGFIMGPAGLLAKVMTCVILYGQRGNSFDDQLGLTICAARHPANITLDYASGMVLTTLHLKTDIVSVWSTGVQNLVFRGRQCFVHLNGIKQSGNKSWRDWFLHLKPFQREGPVPAH